MLKAAEIFITLVTGMDLYLGRRFRCTCFESTNIKSSYLGFPYGPVVRNLPCNPGDTGSIPGLERSHVPRGN